MSQGGSLATIADRYSYNAEDAASPPHLQFRILFDVCKEGFDEVVDGLPSLPLNTEITDKQEIPITKNYIDDMFPRKRKTKPFMYR